ncbi:MAG: hypothetical protein AAGE90_00565 [Pseudomonadota bacterium]
MPDGSPHWAEAREAGAGWQLRLMRWTALRLPPIVVDPLLWLVAFAFSINPRRPANAASIDYLTRMHRRRPTLVERHRHALTFAHMFHERVRLLATGTEGFTITAQGSETVIDLVGEGKGGVLLGAHFGSFEALRAFDRKLPGLNVRYLMYPDHAEHSTKLLRELNPEVADRVISLVDGPQAMMEVFEALDRGQFVAFLGDRLPRRDLRGTLSVPFLRGQIDIPTSPYIAAIAAQVPLILCLAPRLGKDRYDLSFIELYDGAPVARRKRDATIKALGHRYAKALEDMCRRHPDNWFNFFDIWGDGEDLQRPSADQSIRGPQRAAARR